MPVNDGSIASLVADWNGFEELIAELHKTGEVVVERNVVLTGRSGAKRQIDVLVRHKKDLYEHLIVIECKYWNSAVERLHVDALATTVREVGASRGVIFSVNGFQSGAIEQAKHDSIDLYKVRELTDHEWGSPGRHIDFFLHYISISLANIRPNGAYAYPGAQPKNMTISLKIGAPVEQGVPIVTSGSDIRTLEGVVEAAAKQAAQKLYAPFAGRIPFGDGSYEGDLLLRSTVNAQSPAAMQAVLPDGVIFIPSITFDIGLSVSQSRFQYDRQKPFIFTFAVEDCVRRISRAAMRRVESEVTSLGELAQTKEDDDNPDLLKNGSIFSIWLAGFRAFDDFENLEPGKPILTKKR